jgi:hypothetical protein
MERRNGRAFRQFFMAGVAVQPHLVAQFIPLVVGWSMEGHAGGIRLATSATGPWGAPSCCY